MDAIIDFNSLTKEQQKRLKSFYWKMLLDLTPSTNKYIDSNGFKYMFKRIFGEDIDKT